MVTAPPNAELAVPKHMEIEPVPSRWLGGAALPGEMCVNLPTEHRFEQLLVLLDVHPHLVTSCCIGEVVYHGYIIVIYISVITPIRPPCLFPFH